MTRDIDVLVLADAIGWEELVKSAERFDIAPRIPDALEFASKVRVLLMQHQPTGIEIDISLGAHDFERAVIRQSTVVETKGLKVPLASPENLIVMKALARRPRDIADIESILQSRPNIDLESVREWLRRFSTLLEMPEIQDDFERLIKRLR